MTRLLRIRAKFAVNHICAGFDHGGCEMETPRTVGNFSNLIPEFHVLFGMASFAKIPEIVSAYL
jgi:hypothetical protein